jgi:hypothetical protein
MSDILVPNLAAYNNRSQLKIALLWPKENTPNLRGPEKQEGSAYARPKTSDYQ